jgi:hypothetical protein
MAAERTNGRGRADEWRNELEDPKPNVKVHDVALLDANTNRDDDEFNVSVAWVAHRQAVERGERDGKKRWSECTVKEEGTHSMRTQLRSSLHA